MSTYERGAVVTARIPDDGSTQRLLRIDDRGFAWRSATDVFREDEVTDVRPLVVLDLSPHEVMRAMQALRASGGLIALEVADKIEAATKPPKPDEPTGLGAVVEERPKPGHDRGDLWIRVTAGGECPWVSATDYSQLEEGEAAGSPYDRIDAARVLSDGWVSQS